MSETNGNGKTGGVGFDEGMCERYLLGELDDAEREQFETSYFNDDAFFNRFIAAKDELLDLYARNELDADTRRRVEKHFGATAPRRKQLDQSGDFIRSVTVVAERFDQPTMSVASRIEAKPASSLDAIKNFFSLPRVATASMLLIAAIAIGFWLTRQNGETERAADPSSQAPPTATSTDPTAAPPERTGTDKDSTAPAQTDAQLPPSQAYQPNEHEVAGRPEAPAKTNNETPPANGETPKSPVQLPPPTGPPESSVATNPKPEEPKQPDPRPEVVTGEVTDSVTLSSASRAVTKSNTAKIGTATRSVAIRILFSGEGYSSYSVRVTTLGGQTIWRASALKTGMNAGAKSLTVTVPAGSLQRKDYIVTLEGRTSEGNLETIREYYLHVDRQ